MPRTLAQNAQYIAETIKPAIKSAIEAQGVTVPSTDSFLDYADRIGEIEGGGSGYQLKDLPTGAISTVTDAAPLPLNALKVSVEAWQEGTGDPSPSNIRPIHGWDSVKVCAETKNKIPMTVDGIKALNISGTWVDNAYTINGVTFTVLTDGGSVTGIKVNGTNNSGNLSFYLSSNIGLTVNTSYILNGTPSGLSGVSSLELSISGQGVYYDNGSDFSFTCNGASQSIAILMIGGQTLTDATFYPMIRPAIYTNSSYEPYNPKSKTYTQQFPQTIYGAEWDVVGGVLNQTDGYIASYNGETLSSTWISDRDVYASGTTPTIGAEVVYKLATPTTIDLSPLSIRLLQGTNNIYADCGEVIEGEYFIGEGGNEMVSIDYTTALYSGTSTSLVTADPVTYTATQPCVAYCEWYGTPETNMCPVLNGNNLTDMYALSDNKKSHVFFLQAGDTLAQRESSDNRSCYFHMTVYGYQR